MATNNPPVFPTAEEFRMFVCSKSCDIISSGAYKKHIMRCKDNGDPWADSVQASCSAVSSYTDHVKMVVRRAQELPTKELDNVIKESLANSSPPCKRWPGPGTCKITGIVAENCLNIARCSTSVDMHGPGRILVHPRFERFFYLLWYCCKIEHVVRNYVRYWMQDQEGSVLETCRRFESMDGLIQSMYRCYKMACAHVCNSMLQYVEYKGASYLGSDTRLAGKPAEGREHVKVHARTRKTNLQEHDRRKRKKKKVV